MKYLFLIFLLTVSLTTVFSQVKKKPVDKPLEKSVPIVYSSHWGPITSGNISAEQIKAILAAAIFVKDNNYQSYIVSGFRINYSFKGSYKDEETGNTKSMKDLRVNDFNNKNTLPQPWIESIKDNIKPGDIILFNKILFRNKEGRLQMGPDIKITVN
jgi:hypothetical protein